MSNAPNINKLENLINLACDDNTTDGERAAAAIAACKLIRDTEMISKLRKMALAWINDRFICNAIAEKRIPVSIFAGKRT